VFQSHSLELRFAGQRHLHSPASGASICARRSDGGLAALAPLDKVDRRCLRRRTVRVGRIRSQAKAVVGRIRRSNVGSCAPDLQQVVRLSAVTSGAPPNKGMKLTKLSAAWLPELTCRLMPAPVSGMDAGTASQLIPGVRPT